MTKENVLSRRHGKDPLEGILLAPSTEKEPFRNVLNQNSLRNDEYYVGVHGNFHFSTYVIGVGGIVAAPVTGGIVATWSVLGWVGGLIAFGLIVTSAGIGAPLNERRKTRPMNFRMEVRGKHLRNSFDAWLKARYAIILPEAALPRSTTYFLSKPQKDGAREKLIDARGVAYWLTSLNGAYHVEEAPDLVVNDYRPEGSVAALARPSAKVNVVALSGEAALLHDRLQEMVRLLHERGLVAENEYLVERVNADAAQAVRLHRELAQLGPVPQKAAAQVTKTLQALCNELTGVVELEQQRILRELSVQNDYITTRQVEANAAKQSHLQLPEDSSGIAPATA